MIHGLAKTKPVASLWDDKSVLIAPSLRVTTYRIKVLHVFVGVDTRDRMAFVKTLMSARKLLPGVVLGCVVTTWATSAALVQRVITFTGNPEDKHAKTSTNALASHRRIVVKLFASTLLEVTAVSVSLGTTSTTS